MPKNTSQKNNKGSKTTKNSNTKNTVKNSSSKKSQTKKVETKKTETKKVETKEVPVQKVETKVVREKEMIKKGKDNDTSLLDRLSSNVPFVASLCVIIVLLAALIYTISSKKVPKTSNGDEIVATVKGKTVTANDLYSSLKEKAGTDTLMNLIDTYIANKEVTITKENEDYVQSVVDYYKDYADYYSVDLETFLTNYVGLSGIKNEDEFYDYVLEDYKKTLAITKYISEEASEDDLKKYYEENYSDKLTVRHILIEVDSEAEDKDKADKDAYDKAVKLIKELNNTDSSNLSSKFEQLAKDNSDDTGTYANGGLFENFSKKDVYEEFYNASYELKDGEYTKEPVKTEYGYHIILKVSSTPVEEYESVKESVKTGYAENLLSSDDTLFIRKWDELRKKYKISIEDDFIKKAYENTISEATKEE